MIASRITILSAVVASIVAGLGFQNGNGEEPPPPPNKKFTDSPTPVASLEPDELIRVARTGLQAERRPKPENISVASLATTPALVQRSTASMQDAWRSIQAAVLENESRPDPLPEPYFARAEIWSQLQNHEEALRDYLVATRLLRNRPTSVLRQNRYLVRLETALDELVRTPRPMYSESAQRYLESGIRFFHKSQFADALPCFVSAVQMSPGDPVGWYYRALTLKSLGRDHEAERDIKVAVEIEERQFHRNWDPRPTSNKKFERIQGSLRMWMAGFRDHLDAANANRGTR